MYVAGFVAAVKTARKQDYLTSATEAARAFKDHGATRVVECWGDDVPEGEVTSFARAVKLEPDETVVFSWMEYPDKQTNEAALDAGGDDPRLQGQPDPGIMSGKRLIWAGFAPLLDV